MAPNSEYKNIDSVSASTPCEPPFNVADCSYELRLAQCLSSIFANELKSSLYETISFAILELVTTLPVAISLDLRPFGSKSSIWLRTK